MKSNITLIGMPGSGKSTVGVILAKFLSFGFIDTDILIQINQQKKLQEIINEKGPLAFRRIEEAEVLKLNIRDHIIATGGSVVYGRRAMSHLKHISLIVCLNVSLAELNRRIDNFETRGIAREKDQTFSDVFIERQQLYEKYADMIVDCDHIHQEKVARLISSQVADIVNK